MLNRHTLMSFALAAGLAQPAFGADRTGIYTGQVTGVVDGRTSITELSGFQPRAPMAADGKLQTYSLDLEVSIENDQGQVFTGTWQAGDQGYTFVCAVDQEANIHCADHAGYVTGKFTPTALYVCRTETGANGKSVGCGFLKKTP